MWDQTAKGRPPEGYREGICSEILCHFGEPSPHSADQEIYLSFLPADTYVDEGRWGIIRGNDPFLYGEKVKAYLRKGAEPLPGFTVYPNSRTGYGRLCLSNSFPKNKKE